MDRSFAANAVRLLLHALACNLGNFMRTLAMPKTAEPWSLTSLREKLIKIGAKVEVAIARLRAPPAPVCGAWGSNATDNDGRKPAPAKAGVRLVKARPPVPARCGRATRYVGCHRVGCDQFRCGAPR